MSNPTQEYNDYIRANLPLGITYDEVRARYVTENGKYFPTYLEAKWYLDYIKKFGFIPVPLSLFANGEQGAWYDPSDLTTLYQDAAGTTPVTADGDPVGLMLDKKNRASLQSPNIFDPSDTPDTIEGGVLWQNVGSNIYEIQAPDGASKRPTVFWDDVLEIGKQYYFDFVALASSGLSGNVIAVDVGNGDELISSSRSTGILTANSTSFGLTIYGQAVNTGGFLRVGTLAIRELPGNHATQSTAAARPVYRTDGTLHWLEFDGVDDKLQNDSVDFGTDTALVIIAAFNNNVPDSNFYAHHAFTHSMGPIQLFTRIQAGNDIGFQADFNTRVTVSASGPGYAPPNLAVIRGVLDLAAPLVSLHQNGALADQSTTSTSASTIGIGPLTVGARDSGARYSGANSRQDFYGCIWRGSLLTESEIASTEAYLASKSGVTL